MIAQRGKYCYLWIQIHCDTKHIPIKSEPAWNQSPFHYTPFVSSALLMFLFVRYVNGISFSLKTTCPCWEMLSSDESVCPERLCCDETPSGELMTLCFTLLPTRPEAQAAALLSFIPGMTHWVAPSCPDTLTESSAGRPERAPDGWQVSCARDVS